MPPDSLTHRDLGIPLDSTPPEYALASNWTCKPYHELPAVHSRCDDHGRAVQDEEGGTDPPHRRIELYGGARRRGAPPRSSVSRRTSRSSTSSSRLPRWRRSMDSPGTPTGP